MGSFRRLVLLTLAITPSGALSPGPLSASAVAIGGFLGPLGGVLIALGHTIVELPYAAGLYKFMGSMRAVIEKVRIPMNVFIVAFLLYFSYLLFKDSIGVLEGRVGTLSGSFSVSGSLEAVAVGVALTGFNAYFLAWWLTVGYPLIEESSKLGVKGFTAMYISHVWMDYAWLTVLAAGGGAARIMGETPYAILLAILAFILLAFAFKIAADTLKVVRRGLKLGKL